MSHFNNSPFYYNMISGFDDLHWIPVAIENHWDIGDNRPLDMDKVGFSTDQSTWCHAVIGCAPETQTIPRRPFAERINQNFPGDTLSLEFMSLLNDDTRVGIQPEKEGERRAADYGFSPDLAANNGLAC